MRVVRVPGRPGSGALLVGVVGSCRVHGPLRALEERGDAQPVAHPYAAYTHTPGEAAQQIRYGLGDVAVPAAFQPLIFGRVPAARPSEAFAGLLRSLDALVVEVNVLTRLACSGLELQQNYFSQHFLRGNARLILDWWRALTVGDRQGRTPVSVTWELDRSGALDGMADWQREILYAAEFGRIDWPAFRDSVVSLADLLGCPLVLVPHFNFEGDEALPERADVAAFTKRASEELGFGHFDPTPLVVAAGRENALRANGADLYHYHSDFEPVLGEALLDAVRSAAPVRSSDAPAPDRDETHWTAVAEPLTGGAVFSGARGAGLASAEAEAARRILEADPENAAARTWLTAEAVSDGAHLAALWFSLPDGNRADGPETLAARAQALKALGWDRPLVLLDRHLGGDGSVSVEALLTAARETARAYGPIRGDLIASMRRAESGDNMRAERAKLLLALLETESAMDDLDAASREGASENLRTALLAGDQDGVRRTLAAQLFAGGAHPALDAAVAAVDGIAPDEAEPGTASAFETLLDALAAEFPDDARARATKPLEDAVRGLATRCREARRFDTALAIVDLLLARLPDDALLLRNAGQLHLFLGRDEEALTPLECLLTLRPGDQSASLLKARALGRLRRFDDASAVLAEMTPGDADERLSLRIGQERDRLVEQAAVAARDLAREFDTGRFLDAFETVLRLVADGGGGLPAFLARHDRPAQFLMNFVPAARVAGRLETAAGLCRKALERDPDLWQVGRLLGQIELDLVEPPEAAIAHLAPAARPDQPVTSYLALLDAQYAAGDDAAALATAERAIELAPDSAIARERLHRVGERLRQREAAGTPQRARHVAILGVSYCGSTFVGSVLGSLPGAAHVGESHWMTKAAGARGVYSGFDFDSDDPATLTRCSCCRRVDCDYFDIEFRRDMARDPAGWYFRLAERLGVDVVISSDKSYPIVTALDPLERYDSIVLFKEPAQAWTSMRKRSGRFADGAEARVDYGSLHGYLRQWHRTYSMLSYGQHNTGRTVFVNLEGFMAEPEKTLERLCGALDLPHAPEALTRIDPNQHAFGGNARVNDSVRSSGGSVGVERRAEVELTDIEARFLAQHEDVAKLNDHMMSEFRRLIA